MLDYATHTVVLSRIHVHFTQFLELLGIPTLIKDGVFKEKLCDIFYGLGVELGRRDIQTCHRIRNNITIVKLSNRKD